VVKTESPCRCDGILSSASRLLFMESQYRVQEGKCVEPLSALEYKKLPSND